MRTVYSEYVQHCMKFYARHRKPKFKSNADKQNWFACESALKDFTEQEQGILLEVYTEGDTIADNIYQISKSKNIKQESIWRLMNNLELIIAKRRGLI